ncbi:PAS domain S-box protein [Paraflavisolibacter sp. H34]|uniref:PAS domain S-box protein n=1 Tax=Huijunlia imazamoxiresistens TaxID=3127457 RepID=UPI00301A6051
MPAATLHIKTVPLRTVFFLAVLLLLCLSVLLLTRIHNMHRAATLVNQSNEVRLALSDIVGMLKEAQAEQRGFLLTNEPSYLINYRANNKSIQHQLLYIHSQVADNAEQQANARELEKRVNLRLQALDEVIKLQQHNHNGDRSFREALHHSRLTMLAVENEMRIMVALEEKLLKERTKTSQHYIFTTPIYSIILTLLALAIIIAAFTRLTRQLKLSDKYLQQSKLAEEEQRKTNRLFAYGEQAARLGSWKWDAAGNEVLCSDNLFRLFGYEPDERDAFRKDLMARILPHELASGEESLLPPAPASSEEKLVKEFRAQRKNGQERFFRAVSWFFKNEMGEKTGIGTVQDITEEFLLKQQLQQRTELSEALVESSVSMIAVIDTQMRYTIWNKACEEQFGLKKDEVIGRHLLEVFSFVKEDKRWEYIQAALQEGLATYKKEQPYMEGCRVAEFSYIPLKNADGNSMGLLIMIHDVTEKIQANLELKRLNRELELKITALRESEAFNRHITDMAPNAIYVFDFNTFTNVYANKQALQIHGYSEEEVARLGKNLLEHIYPPGEITHLLQNHQRLQQAKDDDIFDFEYQMVHKSGETRYQFTREAVFKRNARGEVEQIIGVAVDITELKKAQEKLLELNRELTERNIELQHSNEELASFNYIASHDLQEPLRKIQTFSNFIEEREEGLSQSGKVYLKRMQVAASRMRSLISDLLSFSRAREAKEHQGIVDLNSSLQNALTTLHAAIEEKEALIQADRLPVVEGVAFQLQQLFENLIGNSIKYSQPGTAPFIHITCAPVAPESVPTKRVHSATAYYRISVSDNGIGFEQEYADRIFELFQRLHSKEEYSGTGIGLAICKKIVQNHGGTIQARSEPGQGATFEVYLPAVADGQLAVNGQEGIG